MLNNTHQASSKRWQPPPMNAPAPQPKPRVVVDEKVVRKMLTVNPAIRLGRTTGQIKQSLERGEPLMPQATVAPSAPVSDSSDPLASAIAFFLRSKVEGLARSASAIEAKKRALDAELAELERTAREQVAQFVALLDPEALAKHGQAALAAHTDTLRALNLTPAQVLAARSTR